MRMPKPSEPPRKEPMTVDAFLDWAVASQPEGRFELIDGVITAMSPERIGHAFLKIRAWQTLDDAVVAAGLPCKAVPEGPGVRIDQSTIFIPDALVDCSARLSNADMVAPEPIIVAEVLSPESYKRDMVTKLEGYFRVPCIQHYLVVDPEKGLLVHHARQERGPVRTAIHSGGLLALDPPGLALDLDRLLTDR